ncbi:hypothetical protein ACMWP3_25505, partial [Escherichia coli]|uniref:hypothetical protein n=1 Tax=Escherichia coli TaxID=562 RepID=UPI0039E1328E
RLYCEAVAIAATRGGQDRQASYGVDLGAMDEPLPEVALTDPEEPAAATDVEAALEGERQIDA